jgi:hypothetical protein
MRMARTKPMTDPKVWIPPAAKSVAACTLLVVPAVHRY